ncbi:MAG: tRNA pseudouridine(55) synthase TruB [Candidatus Omnitrophica bacterium]|nr:tRNA pseudouridine(55) synthase TruB [Candidatus Omnitrophota bacterium]MCM8803138.1 tRNA pseudouridine(55) synthase TruB [Candidatus Omnitrophota bacterium]
MDGILNVYKPKGITSYDVIRILKKEFKIKDKIGHGGTLDPIGEGVLIICLGTTTKILNRFLNFDKEYITEVFLGVKTDTDDIDGNIIEKKEVKNLTEEEIINVVKSFEGEIEQIPPVVSAIKHKGVPLYKYYRKGIKIQPSPRKVFIKKIEVLNISLPYVELKVLCSKGTYIRALCRDIGEKLGCGGTQNKLIRTKVGMFKIEDSVKIDDLRRYGIEKYLMYPSEITKILYGYLNERS